MKNRWTKIAKEELKKAGFEIVVPFGKDSNKEIEKFAFEDVVDAIGKANSIKIKFLEAENVEPGNEEEEEDSIYLITIEGPISLVDKVIKFVEEN